MHPTPLLRLTPLLSLLALRSDAAAAQEGSRPAVQAPDLAAILARRPSELREVVERWSADRGALLRRFGVERSAPRREALAAFTGAWRERLASLDFEALRPEGKVDLLLLESELEHETALLDREARVLAETAPLLPFSETISDIDEARRRFETVDPPAAAAALARLAAEVDAIRKRVEEGLKPDGGSDAIRSTPVLGRRAFQWIEEMRRTLEKWFRFHDGYDPVFSWWARAPWKKADEALQAYGKVLRERVAGIREGEDEPILGDPIGREALEVDLAHERIPYSPEELVALAEREFAWCEARMLEASREMGFGEDWKAALEKVKSLHEPPGGQPALIRDLAREAIAFVEERGLVTIPPLAREVWRMEMLSAEAQKESPFFLGGETIQVSFPTESMSHEDKWMSLRGNNRAFARATVHHELIPGHHLQGFMNERFHPHRRAFATPFWTEGWALYWEMRLWDLGFPRTPEERVGMLFWRMHRCARIVFSLGFHLGTMSPAQCVDYLVDRVGHERANATGEVRRSFRGGYGPLYQVAYMLGAIQFRALHAELVGAGKMTERAFHDAILEGGRMPVEMVRARLAGTKFERHQPTRWRFADGPAAPK